jgi:hypothetical protein
MLWIRWAFIAANVVYSLLCLYRNSRTSLSRFGKIAGAAIWIWHLVGVALVVLLRVSAWHLVWWFLLGYLLVMWGVRIMTRMGYYTFASGERHCRDG